MKHLETKVRELVHYRGDLNKFCLSPLPYLSNLTCRGHLSGDTLLKLIYFMDIEQTRMQVALMAVAPF